MAWDRDLVLGNGEAGPVRCLKLVSGLVLKPFDNGQLHSYPEPPVTKPLLLLLLLPLFLADLLSSL